MHISVPPYLYTDLTYFEFMIKTNMLRVAYKLVGELAGRFDKYGLLNIINFGVNENE